MLLIEVSDRSLASDLREKTEIVEGRYRSIEISVPPTRLAPRCQPDVSLDLAALFAVD